MSAHCIRGYLTIMLPLLAGCFHFSFAQVGLADSLQAAWDKNQDPRTLMYLAKACTFRNADKAVEVYRQLIGAAERKGDSLLLAEAYLLAGRFIFYSRQQRVIGRDYFSKAVLLLQDARTPQAKAVRLWAQAWLNADKSPLAYVNTPAVTVFDSSVVHGFLQSIALQEDKFLIAETWLDISGYRYWFSKYRYPCDADKDVDYSHERIARFFDEAGCSDGVAQTLFEFATHYYYECRNKEPGYNAGHCPMVEALYAGAYQMAAHSSNTLIQARVLNHLAYNEIGKGNYAEAARLVKRAEGLARSMNDYDQLLRYLMTYIDLYAAKKDYKNELAYKLKYENLKDSLLVLNNTEQLAYVQNNYENQKRDLQIKSLNERNIRKQEEVRQAWIIAGGIIAALLFTVGLLIVYLKQRSKNARLNELMKQSLEQQLTQVQLQALQAQMNPHFIFNALTSIQSLILSGDKARAIQYLGEFAQLSRMTLENSRKSQIKLKEEINFLQRYLQLEQMRHEQRFEYRIDVDEDIDTDFETVPPMLIQPFVENAIKHGFAPRRNNGKLVIRFFLAGREQHLVCVVDDNGVGRRQSEKMKQPHHASVATLVGEARVKLMSDEAKQAQKYEIDITDKYSETGDPLGTTVLLTIPLCGHNKDDYDFIGNYRK